MGLPEEARRAQHEWPDAQEQPNCDSGDGSHPQNRLDRRGDNDDGNAQDYQNDAVHLVEDRRIEALAQRVGVAVGAAGEDCAALGNVPFIWCLETEFYRSEEHTSELQSLMRISYAVFCLKKKSKNHTVKK